MMNEWMILWFSTQMEGGWMNRTRNEHSNSVIERPSTSTQGSLSIPYGRIAPLTVDQALKVEQAIFLTSKQKKNQRRKQKRAAERAQAEGNKPNTIVRRDDGCDSMYLVFGISTGGQEVQSCGNQPHRSVQMKYHSYWLLMQSHWRHSLFLVHVHDHHQAKNGFSWAYRRIERWDKYLLFIMITHSVTCSICWCCRPSSFFFCFVQTIGWRHLETLSDECAGGGIE